MTFDYFYGRESDLFSFLRIPKMLFTDEHFKRLSAEAKIMYGLLLDRMCLSAVNDWKDEKGRVYIIYTIDETSENIFRNNRPEIQYTFDYEINKIYIQNNENNEPTLYDKITKGKNKKKYL